MMMMMAMRISATMHWLVVAPGMHKQSEFPTRLFLARLVVLSPPCGWAWWAWPPMDMSPGLTVILGAMVLAPAVDVVVLMLQVLGQAVLSDSRGKRY